MLHFLGFSFLVGERIGLGALAGLCFLSVPEYILSIPSALDSVATTVDFKVFHCRATCKSPSRGARTGRYLELKGILDRELFSPLDSTEEG